jgi:lysophospholipase L1-like esterase
MINSTTLSSRLVQKFSKRLTTGIFHSALGVAALLISLDASAALTQTCVSPKTGDGALNSPRPSATYPAVPAQSGTPKDVTWRATYEQAPSGDKLITVTGLHYRLAGTSSWVNAATLTWEWRWGHRDKDRLTAKLATVYSPHNLIPGINTKPIATRLSPRLITPDGGCEIYLAPALNGQSSWRTVGVVGDSLVQSLYFPDDANNTAYPQGWLQRTLNAGSLRVEVEGIGGRKMANHSDFTLPLLEQADGNMVDEFRGQAKYWLSNKALVIALGANDALYVGASGDSTTFFFRANQVKDAIERVLREVSNVGTCVVLVTPPDDDLAGILGALHPSYAQAASLIGNLYVDAKNGIVPGVNPTNLRVVDFGYASEIHHLDSTDNWYADDNLHLNATGQFAYALHITSGVNSCP